MNPFLKGLLAAAAGGAIPVAANALQTCGADPKLLATQSAAGALLTVAAYLSQSPTKPKPRPTDPPPPTDPGGN